MDFLSLSRAVNSMMRNNPKSAKPYPYTGQSGYECMPTVHSDSKGPFHRNIDSMARVGGAFESMDFDADRSGRWSMTSGAQGILERSDGDIIASARQSLRDQIGL